MLYLKHDFYSNFNSGVSSGDNELLSDMVSNELSDLIVYRRSEVIGLLDKLSIKTSKKISDEKLVDIILNKITDTPKLSKGLAFLMSENNQANEKVRVVKGSDGVERKVAENVRAATRSEVDMVASGIVGIGDSFTYKPQLKKEFKISLMQNIRTKTKAVGDREVRIEENKNGKYWLLAFVIIGAGVGTYFYLKHRKKMAAKGLLVEGAEAPSIDTPIVEPVVEPIVQTPTPPIAQPQTPVVNQVQPMQVEPIIETPTQVGQM